MIGLLMSTIGNFRCPIPVRRMMSHHTKRTNRQTSAGQELMGVGSGQRITGGGVLDNWSHHRGGFVDFGDLKMARRIYLDRKRTQDIDAH